MAPKRRSTRPSTAQQATSSKSGRPTRKKRVRFKNERGDNGDGDANDIRENTHVHTQEKHSGPFGIPTEVFTQIASYVLPLDLLRLSRTARTIRSILMSKQSKQIWRRARKNYPVQLPKCPTYLMNEPQFTALVFDEYCQSCWRKDICTAPYFTLSSRLCLTCFQNTTSSGLEILESLTETYAECECVTLLVPVADPTDDMMERRLSIFERLMSRKEIENVEGISRLRQRFHKDLFVRIYTEFTSYEHGSSAQTAYLMRRVELVNDVYDFTLYMHGWLRKDFHHIQKISAEVKDRWEDEVIDRLYSLHYTSIDMNICGHVDQRLETQWLQLTRQNCEVSEMDWESLEPKLKAIIHKNRENLLKCPGHRRAFLREGLEDCYDVYRRECADSVYLPTNIACLRVGILDDFVEDNLLNSSVTVIEDFWDNLLHGGVLEALDYFKRNVKHFFDMNFYAVVDSFYLNKPLLRWDETPLPRSILKHDHAAAFFVSKTMCITQVRRGEPMISDFKTPLHYLINTIESTSHQSNYRDLESAWRYAIDDLCNTFFCSEKTFEIAMALLRSLRCEQSTMEQMDSRKAVFMCLSCSRRKRRPPLMCWQDLVLHYYGCLYYGDKGELWLAHRLQPLQLAIDVFSEIGGSVNGGK